LPGSNRTFVFFKYFPIFKGCFLEATDIRPAPTASAPVTVPVRACSFSKLAAFQFFGCFQKLVQLTLSLTIHIMYIGNNVLNFGLFACDEKHHDTMKTIKQ